MLKGMSKLSLRWKIYSVLFLLLVISQSIQYFSIKNTLQEQYQHTREQIQDRNLQSLNGLLTSSYYKLLEIAQTLSFLTDEESPLAHNQRVVDTISKHFQRFEAQGVLDSVSLYDNSGKLIQAWGDSARSKSESVNSALEFEYPVREIYCSSLCARYIYIPLLNGNQVNSILVLGRQLQDLVVEFKQNTGVDIGIAMKHQMQWPDIPEWNLEFTQLTQRNRNLPLLKLLSSELTNFKTNKSYTVSGFDTENEIFFAVPESAVTDNAVWVLIDDVTREQVSLVTALEQLVQRLMITASALFFIGIGLVEALLYRLNKLTDDVLDIVSSTPEMAVSLKQKEDIRDPIRFLSLLVDQFKRVLVSKTESEKAVNSRFEEALYALNQEREVLSSLMDNTQNIILTQNMRGHIVSVNTYAKQLFGDDIAGSQISFSGRFLSGEANQKAFAQMRKVYAGQEALLRCESQGLDKFGECRSISWIHARHSLGAGHEATILSIGMDVTERRKAEERLAWLAFHNPLTASANKKLFWESLPKMISDCERTGRYLAVLCCEIGLAKKHEENFIPVIDDLHTAVVQRVSGCLREDDLLTHFSDDIYMVVLEGVKEVDSINLIAKKILNVFTEPFSLNNLKFYASINIGISVCPEHSTEVAELVSSAESAMHMSKMQGMNKYQYYLSSFI